MQWKPVFYFSYAKKTGNHPSGTPYALATVYLCSVGAEHKIDFRARRFSKKKSGKNLAFFTVRNYFLNR